jgi:hypothetical protein
MAKLRTISIPRKWINIMIGIIAVLLILGVWYLVMTVFLSNSKTQTGDKTKTNSKTVEKPYKIAYQGDKNDKSGRTVLAQGQRAMGLLPDRFGWTTVYNEKLKINGYSQGIGIFNGWKKIEGSKDRYLFLKNPEQKNRENMEFGVRIVFEPITTNLPTTSFKETQLSVQNLDYGYYTKSVSSSTPLGYLKDFTDEKLSKILRYGDVVTIYPEFLDLNTAKQVGSLSQKDEKGATVAMRLLIRRFGGKETILSELGK